MAQSNTRRRPRDEEGGIAVEVDLDFLTPSQRRLWDRTFPDLQRWTEGSICQATFLELWSFDHICMLEDVLPSWPPELGRELGEYASMINEYMANRRAAREGSERE